MARSFERFVGRLDIAGAIVVEGDDGWVPERAISREANRWSGDGQPTAYVAGDAGVALAEAARHLDPAEPVRTASLWRVQVHVERAIDLRDRTVTGALDVPTDPAWILDRDACRSVADRVRRDSIGAMIVPSAAFLDAPDRFDVVVFAEAVPGAIASVLRDARRLAVLDPVGDEAAT